MEKILVINNDFDAMELLQKWLQRKGYKVKYMGDEDEVADIVKDFKPDLVLVDVLKEMAAKELKSSEKTKGIPILMMTGYTVTSQNYPKENVDDVIEKPFDPLELDKKIERLLKRTG